MKKFKCTLLLFLTVLTINSYGDVIITQRQPVKICVKINNLTDYPDIVIIGINDCLAASMSKKAFIVVPDSFLVIHKACPLKLYAVKKSYFEKKGINKIKWGKDKNVIESNIIFSENVLEEIENKGEIVNSPKTDNDGNIVVWGGGGRLHTKEMIFNIAGFDDTSMIMYKTTQIDKYDKNNGGRPDSVRNFNYEGDLSKLQKGF